MNKYFSFGSRPCKRRAIVLLVVLGMLSLFSVLVVTYVVFSSQMRQTALGNSIRRDRAIDEKPIGDAIIQQIAAGGGLRSATFGNDLLGDLYGVDQVNTRVAHQRATSGSTIGLDARAVLLQPFTTPALPALPAPQTTLFKLPLHFADWHNDGTGGQFASEVVAPLTLAEFADTGSPGYPNGFKDRLLSRNLPDYRLNDVFTGRLLTFAQGPLAGNTFRIIRYFGTVPMTAQPEDIALAGCVVIDLAESKSNTVLFGGSQWDLLELANSNPNALAYDPGADEAAGFAGSAIDQLGEPLSDDFGFRLLINGSPFNGMGQNATGQTQITRDNSPGLPLVIDPQFGPELLPNRRFTGVALQPGQPDEQYDAGDFDNWFLAWQPADHRRILPSVATLAGLPNDAAPNVIPSYHRPEVINYLMHQPIVINGVGRTFAQLDPMVDPDDVARLQLLARRLRAATYRPLNFEHLFVSATAGAFPPTDPRRMLFSDLDGDGSIFDGAPAFTGSNATAVLNEPIAVNGTISFIALKNRIRDLAIWLTNGPWDVDNDRDGVPDSVWVDFDLPTQVLGNGTVVKPMVAALIEDMDGRINLNATGSYAQITSRRFLSNNPTSYANDAAYFGMASSLRVFGRGGGIGPADINFSHLFDEYRPTNPANNVAPIFINQTSNPFSSVLTTRYGNILQSRYGGNAWDFDSTTLSAAYFPIAHPGANTGTAPYLNFSDPYSRLLLPIRRDLHAYNAPMGRPLDMFGRSSVRKALGGNAIMDAVDAVVPAATPLATPTDMAEVVNQPYEFEIDEPVGDDRPFTASEFHSLVNKGSATALSQRLTGLIGDAAESNEALSRLLTFESRSLDGVELPGGQSVVQYLVDRLPDALRTNPALVNVQIQRMLAVELRKGSKLNLNRPLANGRNDTFATDSFTDEAVETQQAGTNAFAAEPAFPWINIDSVTGNSTGASLLPQATVQADYLPVDDVTNTELPELTGGELLARNLYCLMFRLILDPAVDPANPAAELVPNFPYPARILAATTPDVPFRNRFVAKRLAQWAVNVVDMRDTGVAMTRLRYDPNPFDANGFDLATAAANVVWGMERPEIELTESLAFHDRRVKRNLATPMDPMNPGQTADGQLANDEPPGPIMAGDPDPDQEMDQFRIPEASAMVELRSLRDPYVANGSLESYPSELYELSGPEPLLDLGRMAGTGAAMSPVWRLAVGYTSLNAGDTEGYRRSVLWANDAERMASLPAGVPSPLSRYMIAGGDFAAGDPNATWPSKIAAAGDISHPVGSNSVVSLYDDDLDPATPSPSSVPLERFVWFTNISPASLSIVGNPSSGMTRNNVFFRQNIGLPTNASPLSVNPLIPSGGYAVVLPREETTFGLTEQSLGVQGWPYYPSEQRFSLFSSVPGEYSLRYFDLNNRRGSPNYPVDSAASYRVRNIVPIVAASLPPHLAQPTATAFNSRWETHYDLSPTGPAVGVPMVSVTAVEQRATVGFNISAPLSGFDITAPPGANYYEAPTQRINDGSMAPNQAYPKVDGYRSYDGSVGLHPDMPFDERMGAPLQENGWIGVGSYQDVANLFLQRLADPTRAWDATNNPYITVDTLTMDLTVFNGDADLREQIDRDGDMNPVEPVDLNTLTYPVQLAFDTRRKIPDPSLDRPASQLVINAPTSDPMLLNDMSNYKRVVYAQRSPLMMQQNALRNGGEMGPVGPGTRPYFRHQLVSAWEDGLPAPAPSPTVNLHSGFRFDATRQRFDAAGQRYPQTLGFVNREIGEPAMAGTTFAGSTDTGVVGRYVGHPIAVSYQLPTWLDRPFQSPYELMSVPATSASRLAREFGPGTVFDPINSRETPSTFGYLLGFEANLGNFIAGDTADLRVAPASIVDASTTPGFTAITGARAGFEQIFDLVDIGPLSFGQRRWFDPRQTLGAASGTVRNDMFNRVVQTLRAPFNYVDRHRTPGKVNLNTTPDYIRQGGGYASQFVDFQRPFTAGTAPATPTATAGLMSGISSEPTNYRAGGTTDPFNTALLYGNGSVYQAITAGISTAYDLDDTEGEPVTLGEYNGYKETTDSRFGFNFKNFVQSRRGYSTSLSNAVEDSTQLNFFNIDLDFRYPSRFAGMFAPTAAATLPSTQRYLRMGTSLSGESTLRRTHDMSLLRTHPDFDLRVMDATQRGNATNPGLTAYAIGVETAPVAPSPVSLPALMYEPNANGTNDPTSTTQIASLRMPLFSSGLFERTQADLHKDFRGLDRDPFYRFKNASQLSGMTTHHSNVFTVRYTVGFFTVDVATGAIGNEYLDPRSGYIRPSGSCVIDRTIPVGYEPNVGISSQRTFNTLDTVIFSSTN